MTTTPPVLTSSHPATTRDGFGFYVAPRGELWAVLIRYPDNHPAHDDGRWTIHYLFDTETEAVNYVLNRVHTSHVHPDDAPGAGLLANTPAEPLPTIPPKGYGAVSRIRADCVPAGLGVVHLGSLGWREVETVYVDDTAGVVRFVVPHYGAVGVGLSARVYYSPETR